MVCVGGVCIPAVGLFPLFMILFKRVWDYILNGFRFVEGPAGGYYHESSAYGQKAKIASAHSPGYTHAAYPPATAYIPSAAYPTACPTVVGEPIGCPPAATVVTSSPAMAAYAPNQVACAPSAHAGYVPATAAVCPPGTTVYPSASLVPCTSTTAATGLPTALYTSPAPTVYTPGAQISAQHLSGAIYAPDASICAPGVAAVPPQAHTIMPSATAAATVVALSPLASPTAAAYASPNAIVYAPTAQISAQSVSAAMYAPAVSACAPSVIAVSPQTHALMSGSLAAASGVAPSLFASPAGTLVTSAMVAASGPMVASAPFVAAAPGLAPASCPSTAQLVLTTASASVPGAQMLVTPTNSASIAAACAAPVVTGYPVPTVAVATNPTLVASVPAPGVAVAAPAVTMAAPAVTMAAPAVTMAPPAVAMRMPTVAMAAPVSSASCMVAPAITRTIVPTDAYGKIVCSYPVDQAGCSPAYAPYGATSYVPVGASGMVEGEPKCYGPIAYTSRSHEAAAKLVNMAPKYPLVTDISGSQYVALPQQVTAAATLVDSAGAPFLPSLAESYSRAEQASAPATGAGVTLVPSSYSAPTLVSAAYAPATSARTAYPHAAYAPTVYATHGYPARAVAAEEYRPAVQALDISSARVVGAPAPGVYTAARTPGVGYGLTRVSDQEMAELRCRQEDKVYSVGYASSMPKATKLKDCYDPTRPAYPFGGVSVVNSAFAPVSFAPMAYDPCYPTASGAPVYVERDALTGTAYFKDARSCATSCGLAAYAPATYAPATYASAGVGVPATIVPAAIAASPALSGPVAPALYGPAAMGLQRA